MAFNFYRHHHSYGNEQLLLLHLLRVYDSGESLIGLLCFSHSFPLKFGIYAIKRLLHLIDNYLTQRNLYITFYYYHHCSECVWLNSYYSN